MAPARNTNLSQWVITFSPLTQNKMIPTLLPAALTTSQTRRNLQKYSKHLDVVPPWQLNPCSLSHTVPGGKPTAEQGRGGHAVVISASSKPRSVLQPLKPPLVAGLVPGALSWLSRGAHCLWRKIHVPMRDCNAQGCLSSARLGQPLWSWGRAAAEQG